MKIPSFIKEAQKFLDDNSPVILTAMGIVGVGVTAVLTHKAATNTAVQIYSAEVSGHYTEPLTTKDKLDIVWGTGAWKDYIPAVAAGAGTAGCMFMATRIGLRRTAVLGALYAMSNDDVKTYKAKVEEKLGVKKATEINDSIASDQVAATPVPGNIIIGDTSEQMFFDRWSGRYFVSTRQKLDKAVNDFNHEMIYGDYASLSEFYKRIGLEETQESDEIGWNKRELLELTYTATVKDDVAVIAVEFDKRPMPTFQDTYDDV